MPVLTSSQRKALEDVCLKARRAAEQAVTAALTTLAVVAERVPAHLHAAQRRLRNGLRAKARQLGDQGAKLDLLVAECAYEQWHRLLFARFLAENELLVHPEYGATVTLDECAELADELGEPDGWAVAARLAAEILPGIFRLDDPCVRLRLAPEGRLALERLLTALPREAFVADDALGWVYQFWQKDRKDEVNLSEAKIGGADLGPVTQLFTENYMVRFLLENSLGAWWAGKHPDSPLLKSWGYLRFDHDGKPAAGSFEEWPQRAAEVTVMDPCCGSGHFLVEAFSMLWQMRVEEEGLTPADAQDAVLRDNLFGLELDPRCVQIGMFNVALQAWKAGRGWRELPVLNIACSGIPVKAPVDEWKALAEGDARLENALVRLHILFRNADTLGSLIDPKRAAEITDRTMLQRSIEDVDWEEIVPFIERAVQVEAGDPASAVLGADIYGHARAADFLARSFILVATNPPFLGRGDQSDLLQDHLDVHLAIGRQDLATGLLVRAERLAAPNGTLAFVLPQNSLSLTSFKDLRRHMLTHWSLGWLANLGARAFQSIGGEVVKPVLLVASTAAQSDATNCLVDVSDLRSPAEKAAGLASAAATTIPQAVQLGNPDCRILFTRRDDVPSLSQFAASFTGLQTGEDTRYKRFFWELSVVAGGWERVQSSPSGSGWGRGREKVILWDGGKGEMATSSGATIRGRAAWGRTGIVVSKVGSLYWTNYEGGLFDDSAIVVLSGDAEPAVAAFIKSDEFRSQVRIIDQKAAVTPGTVVKVPFDVNRWQGVADGVDAPNPPVADDPTQWLFEGHPVGSTEPLQVAVGRLVGFRWPDQPEDDGLSEFADDDGIVCLPSVSGEAPAADRLQALLATAYGDGWSPGELNEMLEAAGSKRRNLADWLQADFFKQHCSVFGNRPFVWHIWDGKADGFSALVNYHKLDNKLLQKLAYSYLGGWIERQRAEVKDDKAGAEARLAAALELQNKLELILAGEPPYDIYVRWKSLAEQPIGWNPDVNDGVRLNIRPFVEAGVLRSKVNVKWEKDRGKNPDGSDRHNDLHCTVAEKRAARGCS